MPTPDKAEPVVHYAPYGRNAIGQFECWATDGGYTGQPYYVTCELCKAKSPGLWPEIAAKYAAAEPDKGE